MNDKQPEALRLADEMESLVKRSDSEHWGSLNDAANELRRLHEVNAEMLMALYAVEVWLFSGEGTGFQNKVSAAIDKAEGRS